MKNRHILNVKGARYVAIGPRTDASSASEWWVVRSMPPDPPAEIGCEIDCQMLRYGKQNAVRIRWWELRTMAEGLRYWIDDHWLAMSDEFVAWASETYHDWGREKAVILGIGGKPCTGMDFTRFLRAVSQNHKITFTGCVSTGRL